MTTPEESTTKSERQRAAREEWRRLCDALENAQGEELVRTCRNRYQLIKTYKLYGSKFDQIVSDLKKAADKGDFSFFRERGVPTSIMDWRFAQELLQVWKTKIQDKKRQVEQIYNLQYGEPLPAAMRTDEEAFKLDSVEPLHTMDALMQLSGMSQPDSDDQIKALRDEVHRLRSDLVALSEFVKSELTSIRESMQK
ncbi:MAG: hypothetical protein KDA60_09855 [Planctomycetales bacterium]|nr:hypothetical protein [Planctomycetales bacterium]